MEHNEKRLKILIANDDGIEAEGLRRLAAMAAKLGDVWVCAPAGQCSAMSQRLTIFNELIVREHTDFENVRAAYSVTGTPADCVKVALMQLLPEKPDYVFSGINFGYNTGYDIAYSGTIGAALEAVMSGIPAIAFSAQHDGTFDVAEEYMLPLAKELIAKGQSTGEVWNINFPGCALDELKGIKYDTKICRADLYENYYHETVLPDGARCLKVSATPLSMENAEEGTDVRAVLENYISVGKVKSMVL